MRHTSLAGLVNDATVGVDDAEDKDGGGEGVPGDQHEDDDGGSELGEVSERAVRAVELPGGAVLDHDDGRARLRVRSRLRVFVAGEVAVLQRAVRRAGSFWRGLADFWVHRHNVIKIHKHLNHAPTFET